VTALNSPCLLNHFVSGSILLTKVLTLLLLQGMARGAVLASISVFLGLRALGMVRALVNICVDAASMHKLSIHTTYLLI